MSAYSVAQSCPDSCDPMVWVAHQGSSVRGISILEWVAIRLLQEGSCSSRASSLYPGITPVPLLPGGFFVTETPGKPSVEARDAAKCPVVHRPSQEKELSGLSVMLRLRVPAIEVCKVSMSPGSWLVARAGAPRCHLPGNLTDRSQLCLRLADFRNSGVPELSK